MAYTEEQKKQALKNRTSREITFEMMEELRALTALSFEKLETYVSAAQAKIKLKDENEIFKFNARSRSALSRDAKKKQSDKSAAKLKITREKTDEGQLRIRIIEIPIYYGQDENEECDVKKAKEYEIMRWLCCYETRSRYFACTNISTDNFPPTQNFIMAFIKKLQTTLKIPFESIVFTQKVLDYSYENKKLDWDWISSSILSDWIPYNDPDYDHSTRKLVSVKQIDFPSKKHEQSIKGLDNKKKFLKTFKLLVDAYQSSVKPNLKEKQRLHKGVYEQFGKELKKATLNNNSDPLSKAYVEKQSTGETRIKFDSIMSDKKFKKLKQRIETEIAEKAENKIKELQSFVKKHSVKQPEV